MSVDRQRVERKKVSVGDDELNMGRVSAETARKLSKKSKKKRTCAQHVEGEQESRAKKREREKEGE